MQAKDELSVLVFTQILLVRFNIEVLTKTIFGKCGRNLAGGHKQCKVLTKSRSKHFVILLVMLFSLANAQLRLIVILADPSTKLVNITIITSKDQPRHQCFVLFCFFSCGNLLIPVSHASISLFGHNLGLLTITKWL